MVIALGRNFFKIFLRGGGIDWDANLEASLTAYAYKHNNTSHKLLRSM